jgi:hypothetical protein
VSRTIIIAALLLSGCADDGTDGSGVDLDIAKALRSAPVPKGPAVIVVDGRSIPLAVVERQVLAGRPKAQVVEELVQAELFYERALSMDYAADDAVVEEHKRLMVQRLLAREVEAKNPPSGIAPARVRKYYSDNNHLYFTPELRAANHLLVKPSAKKWDTGKNWDQIPPALFKQCDLWSERIRQDITERGETPVRAAELQVIADRWSARLPADLDVIVEQLPGSPKRPFREPGQMGYLNAMVPEFADAMFALAQPGTLSQPVRTSFGSHLLVVTKIRPEDKVPLTAAEPGIRELLATQDRTLASKAYLTELLNRAVLRADESKLAKFGDKATE